MKILLIYKTYTESRLPEISCKGWKILHKDRYGRIILDISKNGLRLFAAKVLQTIFKVKYRCKACGSLGDKFYGTKKHYTICSRECWNALDSK